MKTVLVIIAFLGLLAYKNPTMDQYAEYVIQQRITEQNNNSERSEGIIGMILHGMAHGIETTVILASTTRTDYVFASTYHTSVDGNEIEVVGFLGGFYSYEPTRSVARDVAGVANDESEQRKNYRSLQEQHNPILESASGAMMPAAAPPAGALTLDQLKNASYVIDENWGWPSDNKVTLEGWGWSSDNKVTMKDGKAESKAAPDSITTDITTLGDVMAYGDLNGDSKPDSAVILITNFGGSGTFYSVAAVLNDNGVPKHVTTQNLGDRIEVQSLSIMNGTIQVMYLDHKPNESMGAVPTLSVYKQFDLAGPSFDCAEIQSTRFNGEWYVCEMPHLAYLDRRLSEKYKYARLLTKYDVSAHDNLKYEQRAWIKKRNDCDTVRCVEIAYGSRLQELENITKSNVEVGVDVKNNAVSEVHSNIDKQVLQERPVAELQSQARAQSALSQYIPYIQDKVNRAWIRPPGSPAGLVCVVRVRLIPGGAVVGATVIQSSGDPVFDRSVELAVLKASPLPLPPDPALFNHFREINFKFNPGR